MQQATGNISSVQSEILQLESTIKNLLQQGLGPENTHVLAVQAELTQKRDQYATLIAGERNALEINSKMAPVRRVALLEKKVADLKAKNIADQSKKIAPFVDADREYQKQLALLETLNIHYKENASDYQLLESIR